ncbi:galactose mutarotase [Prochlorococcus marinus]|uniref:Galactose mutarotase-related enzyme n=1 Tax=Prochlorococcus marinus (strain MIT 9211) TaxID=93059 RepID=A9BCT9_PROM4|nr:galactose mutarotase [Prochlorococcus marinus]ABX09651.1 Galactose mutarotase-related enzyme [Prochlorococcus marinus str. MIT 9211]
MPLIQKNLPYPHWQYVFEETGDFLKIVPDRGGLITGWNHQGREILYFDLDRFQQGAKSIRGGIPVLFPICGDLPQGHLRLAQGEFSLRQHGFARDMPWLIKPLEDQEGFVLTLTETAESLSVYPFMFLIEMEVRLTKTSLNIKTIIHNLGDQSMPFSFGLHPYFNVKSLENCLIKGLPDKCINHMNLSEASTEEQLQKLSKGVDFIAEVQGPISLEDCIEGTRIELHHESPMDLAVIWTDPPRHMICLEPWTSPRQSLITGNRMLLLEPQSSQELLCRFVSN